uniref:Hop1 n=1 Tax=Pentatrichomonas hominis TaxID=5728 RepID=A0A0A6Z4A3_9EUKA|nr:Hop1 [Pentatrichomonas hominis]
MAARTAQRTRQATDTITEVQSVTLVRNILRSSVSSIAYLRYLFPEDNFEDTQLAGLKIKSLVPSSNPEVAAINNWLEKGVFDALEKHYLKAMVFSIFLNQTIQPVYWKATHLSSVTHQTIAFRWILQPIAQMASRILLLCQKSKIQQAWCTMIRTLITLSHTLPPLPSQRNLAMRLYYYEDVTPADYDPPGFDNASSDPDFEFIAETERIEVGGSVRTRHHAVSLRLDTALGAIRERS